MYSLLPIVFRKNGNNGLFEILKKKEIRICMYGVLKHATFKKE
jgi:hypothetical protein